MAATSKFDQSLADIIIECVAKGNYPKHACEFAGVAKRTHHYWMEKGLAYEKAIEAGKKPEIDHSHLAGYRRAIIRAQAQALVNLNGELDKAGKTDWRCMAWKMGKLAPNEFGEREKMNPLDAKIADRDRIKGAQESLKEDTRSKLANLGEEIADQMAGET